MGWLDCERRAVTNRPVLEESWLQEWQRQEEVHADWMETGASDVLGEQEPDAAETALATP